MALSTKYAKEQIADQATTAKPVKADSKAHLRTLVAKKSESPGLVPATADDLIGRRNSQKSLLTSKTMHNSNESLRNLNEKSMEMDPYKDIIFVPIGETAKNLQRKKSSVNVDMNKARRKSKRAGAGLLNNKSHGGIRDPIAEQATLLEQSKEPLDIIKSNSEVNTEERKGREMTPPYSLNDLNNMLEYARNDIPSNCIINSELYSKPETYSTWQGSGTQLSKLRRSHQSIQLQMRQLKEMSQS